MDKSISPARQSDSAGDKQRTGDAMIRLFRSRMTDRQRTERERRDRYGRFGGR
jgi:hypothetical protein